MSARFKQTLGLIALAGFIISFFIHILTYFGIDAATYLPPIWTLHIGIFVVFIPFVFTTQSLQKEHGRHALRLIMADVPTWAKLLLGIIFAYTMVNFLLFIQLSEGGSPAIENGRYILQSHGTFIRELTTSEYNWQLAYITRGFSGHWLLFYAVPAAYFLFSDKQPSTTGASN